MTGRFPRRIPAAALLALAVVLSACDDGAERAAPAADAASAWAFGACADPSPAAHAPGPIRSYYVPMPDGERIAVDVVLPDGLAEGARVPAVLSMTRYWRGGEGDGHNALQAFWPRHGYAVVIGDSRGTGASSGTWRYSRSKAETDDFDDVVDWIVAQPWSDGTVGATGTSYAANTSDWVAAQGHAAVKAIAPRFPDYDLYDDLYFPGGILHAAFGEGWGGRVKAQDLNQPLAGSDGRERGVRPVDGDSGAAQLARHVAARRDVPSIYEGLREVEFRDDAPAAWGASLDASSIHNRAAALEEAGTPMLTWASWLDAGTANGALHRFAALSNPQRVIIGPWSHGARNQASPYQPADAPLQPSVEEQAREDLCFFERWVRGRSSDAPERLVVYYTLGEERWKTTGTWPPAGATSRRWYLAPGGGLAAEPPAAEGGDEYAVDFEASTGTTNRWHTQWGGGDVVYPDRAEADEGLLTWTSEPLAADLEVTGHPVVSLRVASTHEDGAFHVYLEDVAPDGRVTYVTEGQLRALHRAVSDGPRPYPSPRPYHTYARADARPLVPGEPAELRIGLFPTSALFRAGHRIRIALAGADRETFVRIPETGDPVVTVFHGGAGPSWVELPVVAR